MTLRGRGDGGRIDPLRELLERSGGMDAILLRQLFRAALVDIVNGDQLSGLRFRVKARVITPDVTNANHADSKFAHAEDFPFDANSPFPELLAASLAKNHS